MCPSSWQRTAACCHSGRFSLMAIVLRRSVRFQKPLTSGGRATKYTMQFSSFARRYGSDVSYRFTRFLTRRGMFIGFTSFAVVIINEKGLVPNHGTSPFCFRCGTSHCVLILGATNRVFVPLCYLGGEFLSSAFEIEPLQPLPDRS